MLSGQECKKFSGWILPIWSLRWGALAALDGYCPLLGPVLPVPTHSRADGFVKSFVIEIKSILDGMTSQFTGPASAVAIKSVHEVGLPIKYSFTPPRFNRSGVERVDSNTLFCIDSISILFPVLSISKLEGVECFNGMILSRSILLYTKTARPPQRSKSVNTHIKRSLGRFHSTRFSVAPRGNQGSPKSFRASTEIAIVHLLGMSPIVSGTLFRPRNRSPFWSAMSWL